MQQPKLAVHARGPRGASACLLQARLACGPVIRKVFQNVHVAVAVNDLRRTASSVIRDISGIAKAEARTIIPSSRSPARPGAGPFLIGPVWFLGLFFIFLISKNNIEIVLLRTRSKLLRTRSKENTF